MLQFADYKHYQRYLDDNFDEEQQLTIENFISYYMNILKGFRNHNCLSTYENELKNDTHGNLHQISIIGYNLLKKNLLKKQTN